MKLFAMIGILSAIVLTGCKKDKITGCTNTNAENFDSSAEEDDGSCQYKGSQVLWYGKATADSLYDDASTSLTYKVEGAIVGSSAASVYYTSAPDCGKNGSITVEKSLGGSTSKSFSYKVTDDFGDVIWSGNLLFEANTCTATELTY